MPDAEPGSFRDPESRVFRAQRELYRALSEDGLADFDALAASGLLDDPRIVRTVRVESTPALSERLLTKEVAAVLRHETVPFVSYPYEWTFSMLKDAALLQLDLLFAALERGLTLKDATPYNVQFAGARPVFIDVGSFERLREGELWVGYRQFCMLYLYPLLLQAVKGASFQPWLRGSIDGITPTEMRALTSFRDLFRHGFATHVFLHARLEQRDTTGRSEVERELGRSGLATQVTLANVRKLRRLVARLDWTPRRDVWVAYDEQSTYSAGEAQRKEESVRVAVRSAAPGLVWDLGANRGRYGRIASETARYVVALDAGQGPVELLYRELRDEGNETILPLTMNLADPSPGLGWRGGERKPLLERGRPDLILALALVHHLSIGANIPVRELVDWLAEAGASVVVEFPERDDPMVQKLLARKRAGLHPDYDRAFFERCLREAFDVRRSEELQSGMRTLYFATPKV